VSTAGPFSSSEALFTPLGDRAPALGAAIAAEGLGALVLTSPESVYYTTGYPTLPTAGNPILFALRNRLPPFAIVSAAGEVALGCWGFSVEGVALTVDRVIAFNDLASAKEGLAAAIRGLGAIGIESTCPWFIGEIVREQVGGGRIALADHVVAGARLIKSAEEIERLARSLAIVERTVGELFGELAVGTSRVALMNRSKQMLLANGADGVGHVTFTFGTTNPEIALDEPFAPGSLAVLDLGAIVDGYCSDNRRYAFAGEVPDELRGLHETMVAIVDGVGAALVPGAPYRAIQDLTRELHREHGVPMMARFTHAGHNIGLETEEEWIVDDSDAAIRRGMVINIELYATNADGHQIGDEETYVVEDAPRRISQLPREIRSI